MKGPQVSGSPPSTAHRPSSPLAAALLSLALAGSLGATEIQETLSTAYQAFLEGRLEDSAAGFRYLATIGVTVPDPDTNLALLAREMGRQDEALPLWVKTSLMEDADGFVWNQRAWSYLSAEKLQEAREAFLKAIERSSTTASQAEANLGLGMTALAYAQPKAAMAPLRSALIQGPYILPAASYQTALTALAVGEKSAALAFLRQSVDLDGLSLEPLRELARLYERIGETRSAYRAYHRLRGLDPGSEEASQRLKRLASYITGDPEASLPIRRLSRPLLVGKAATALDLSRSTVTLRVALYTAENARPATATRLYFMANSDFRLVAARDEVVKDDGKSSDQWEVSFRPENNLVEVRDAARNIVHTAKQPFRIVPGGREGSVLIKSARFLEDSGFDAGDREVRGALEVIPTPYGFKLVNELILEDYLLGAVAAALAPRSPLEAYKAQAVVSRTIAQWFKAHPQPNLERAEICDSARCQRYLGINEEMRDASRAVAETEGQVLTLEGRVARVSQHENCGGRTESGEAAEEEELRHLVSADDAPLGGLPLRTPIQLERWTHEFPPRDRFCEAGVSPHVESRWVRILEASELQARAGRLKDIGSLRHLRVARRTATGRIRALEAQGSRGKLLLEGAKAVSEFLSPGSLRSTLFTIQPLMRGRSAQRFLLWGAGTGHGLGLCRAGALGQASLGRDFRQILSVYFPHLTLAGPAGRQKPSARAEGSKAGTVHTPSARRPRNPRRAEKK